MSTRAQKDVSLEYSEDEKTALAPSKLELYQIALSTRNFEISLFWERSNYFLGLNTAIAVGFFALDDPYRRVFAVLGFLSSCLWFRVCLGGKFWQTRWEQRLKQVEQAFFPQLRFFSATEEQINADVRQGLDDRGNWLRGSIYYFAKRRPSVSFAMILLSVIFLLGWFVFLIMSIQLWLCSRLPMC